MALSSRYGRALYTSLIGPTGMAKKGRQGIVCIYTLCVFGAGLVWADTVLAQNGPVPGQIDTDFVVRTLLGILLAVIAYYTKGLENNVKELRTKFERLYESQQQEYRQYQTAIGLLKEMLYKDFPSKAEIDPKLQILYEELRHIHKRVDAFTRRRADQDDTGRNRRSTDRG